VTLSEFDYELPRELIAQEPLPDRGSSRLMVLEFGLTRHCMFADLPGYMRKGDVLVLNDSRVIPARLRGKRGSGGRVELLLLGAGGETVEALVRAKPLKKGESISLPGASCEVEERLAGSRYRLRFSVPGGLAAYLETHGEMPTPPYIKKRLEKQDRYQTVFARQPGSVAAPTAGLHFTPRMIGLLEDLGVTVAFITLHIGPATFQPIRESNVEMHTMEPEYFRIPENTAAAINGRKGRLVVVGTTVVKALESAAMKIPGGRLAGAEGWSELFIHPGHRFLLRPDMMLTNFHLPRSTLIMLVSALVGRERLLGAYGEAVREKYRFYSFGDSMLCYVQAPGTD
jgi:S-adenosylmethionine:tRNA ribosyltransferase-isomerase